MVIVALTLISAIWGGGMEFWMAWAEISDVSDDKQNDARGRY